MKTIHNITSALVAAGSAGVALMTLSNLIPAELGFATLTVLGITGFVLFDYARHIKTLRPVAPVLRPTLPAGTPTPHITRRVAAIIERAA